MAVDAAGGIDTVRRERIRSRLSRFGPGPVGWFTDICTLVDQELPLTSTGMLASHLFRELESAVRDVLLPDHVRRTENKDIPQGGRHLFQVNGILTALGIEPDSFAGSLWLGEAKRLHSYAHRTRMEQSGLDAGTRARLTAFEEMLEVVLDAFEARYLTVIARLEALAAKEAPSSADVNLLRTAFPQDFLTQERFFSLLGSPAWLPHLYEAGLFSKPVEPEKDEEAGTVAFPAWPASTYLVRVAAAAPAETLRIAEAIPTTSNPRINLNIVEVAQLLPPGDAVRLTARIASSASSWYVIAPERYAQLAVSWARSGYGDQALEVMSALLAYTDNTQRSSTDTYELTELLQAHNAVLSEHVGLAWLERLAAALATRVEAAAPRSEMIGGSESGEKPAEVFREDLSSIWCPDLEVIDTPHVAGTRELLTEAVRDAARHLAADDLTGALRVVDSYPWLIFRRLHLHVLEHAAAPAAVPVVDALTDRVWINAGGVRREWLRLARSHATALDPGDLHRALSVIEAGPDRDRIAPRQLASGTVPTAEEVEQRESTWRRDRYAAFAAALPAAYRQRLRQLITRWGPAPSLDDSPGRLMVWRGEEASGAAVEDLAGKSAADLVDYVQQWTPTPTMFGTDAADFAGRLSAAVTAQALLYQADALLFAPLGEEHLAAVVEGFTHAVEDGQPLDCTALLQLTTRVLHRTRTDGSHELHRALARFWLAALAYTSTSIPANHRDELLDVLRALADNLAPPSDTASDTNLARWSQAQEAAVRAVIAWARWQRGHEGDIGAAFALLDALLTAANQPASPAAQPVGTGIGALIGPLNALNPTWTARHIAALFAPQTLLGRAAWHAYLNSSQLDRDTVGLLMNTYRRAAQTPPEGDSHHQALHQRLGDHLVALYLAGLIALSDTALTDYFTHCSADTAAHLAASIGRTIHSSDLSPQTAARIQQWWEWRLNAARDRLQPGPADTRREEIPTLLGPLLASEAFPVAWRLEQLQAVFQMRGDLGSDKRVFTFLAELADSNPGPSLDLLALWVPTLDQYTWVPQVRESEIRQILLAGLRSATHQQIARDIINRFAYRGYLQFSPLLNDAGT